MTIKDLTKELLELHISNGLSTVQISEIYNVSRQTITFYRRKWDVKWEWKRNPPIIKDIFNCKICGKEYSKSKNKGYCSNGCKVVEFNSINISNLKLNTNNKIGIDIIDLKSKGLSHNGISKLLGCNKSTVSYYCNKNISVKIKDRTNKNKLLDDSTYRFQKMLNNFKTRRASDYSKSSKDWNKKIRMSVMFFKNRNCMSVRERNSKYKYTYHEAIEHLGGVNTKCYLTGIPIDICKDQYCLDHKIPTAKGGDNSLENMGITIPLANYSKSSMDLNEYLDLCKLVLEHNGYEVNKI